MGLETVEIVMDMEDHFHVQIADAAASRYITVGDLQRVILDLLVMQGRSRSPQLEQEVWDGMMAVLAHNRYPVKTIRPDSKWVGDITKHG
jgi:hypothetical protein